MGLESRESWAKRIHLGVLEKRIFKAIIHLVKSLSEPNIDRKEEMPKY